MWTPRRRQRAKVVVLEPTPGGVHEPGEHRRPRPRQAHLSTARSRQRGRRGLSQEAAPRPGSRVPGNAPALHGGPGSVWQRSLLGPRDRQARPHGEADRAGVRQAVRQAPEERHGRCGSASREAAQRPTMRFVALKSANQQADAVVFRTRDLLVRQRTQTINALRGHLAEFGVIAAKGPVHTCKLIAALEDPASDLPQAARGILAVLVEELRSLDERIAVLDREIARHATENSVARRLMTIPGIGAVTAAALTALAPSADTFRRGRDFAAWLGLTPVQRSSGGKERLGRTSRMGQRTLRRLLIIGASAVARWAARKGVPAGSWLGRMLARKPPMLVRVALANTMARIVWALLARGGVYRAPVAAV